MEVGTDWVGGVGVMLIWGEGDGMEWVRYGGGDRLG